MHYSVLSNVRLACNSTVLIFHGAKDLQGGLDKEGHDDNLALCTLEAIVDLAKEAHLEDVHACAGVGVGMSMDVQSGERVVGHPGI